MKLQARVFLLVIMFLGIAAGAHASPAKLNVPGRIERVDYTPDPDELMRIWVVFVDQGDGILVQYPKKFSADSAPVEVLIDGGPGDMMQSFIEKLFKGKDTHIEYGVLTHHDQDHVAGLIKILGSDSPSVSIGTLFHNGLATYKPSRHARYKSENESKVVGAVLDNDDGPIKRFMALRAADRDFLDDADRVNDRDALATLYANGNGDLGGVYEKLARLLIEDEKNMETRFPRAKRGMAFPEEAADGAPMFKILWPEEHARFYKGRNNGWSYTINGNSVTMRLEYGGFSMLFTGDHNEPSEQAWLALLEHEGNQDELDCDVLKIPHHGSDHADEVFFTETALKPVLSVASMGDKGFKAKTDTSNSAWQHPSTRVIGWLGDFSRVYHTYIEERDFEYMQVRKSSFRKGMIEPMHVLIETDGKYFRIVEVDPDTASLRPRKVSSVVTGDGTRWIPTK